LCAGDRINTTSLLTGSGKSELCRYLQKMGFPVLDEGFIDMPNFSLHPQTFTMESIWVSNWIQRVLQVPQTSRRASFQIPFESNREFVFILSRFALCFGSRAQRQEEDKHKSNAIYFVDRSPLSAIFYAKKNGHLLEPTIREQFRELAGLADIHIYTVCIRVERELLWSRIQQRLAREPGRHMFNEGSRQWMEKTLSVRLSPLHLLHHPRLSLTLRPFINSSTITCNGTLRSTTTCRPSRSWPTSCCSSSAAT